LWGGQREGGTYNETKTKNVGKRGVKKSKFIGGAPGGKWPGINVRAVKGVVVLNRGKCPPKLGE